MPPIAAPPMSRQPTLRTERLVLRPFAPADADAVHEIVSDREIAYNTAHIPHPYPEGMAAEWVDRVTARWATGESAVFAVTLRDAGTLIAAVGLEIEPPHNRAEMGYWVARPYWNGGYCTEAARELLRFAFDDFALHRVSAHHYARNPASGKVMQKIGMTYEGRLRQHVLKWGVFEDIVMYGVLNGEV